VGLGAVSGPALHEFDAVTSTQDVAHRLAAEGAEAGTAVVAAEQSAGRGSRGREWSSGRGGLWLSVIWRPTASGSAPEVMSVRAALALAEALEGAGAPRLRIKWPNDLMLGERKLGGILCEARWSGETLAWIVAGAGVNVTNEIPPELAAVACRLADFAPLAATELVAPAADALRRAGATPGLGAAELADFERRDWLVGRAVARPVRGIAAGVAADGALRVRTIDGNITHLRSGAVVPAASPQR
jgi:BirA family biotin operon repressor/biotin-[acetyl-CoA-carboxylase] ligase